MNEEREHSELECNTINKVKYQSAIAAFLSVATEFGKNRCSTDQSAFEKVLPNVEIQSEIRFPGSY